MNFFADLKYSFRLLLKQPSFSLLTILIMALGLGSCIYIYSLLYTLKDKPLAFENSEQIVTVIKQGNEGNSMWNRSSGNTFKAYKDASQSFDYLSYFQTRNISISGDGVAQIYISASVTEDMFNITNTYPKYGRHFNQQDMIVGAEPVAIISHNLWQNYFAGNSDAVGNHFYIEGHKTKVIGIMQEGFGFPQYHDVWLPFSDRMLEQEKHNIWGLQIYGLLNSEADKSQVELELFNIYQNATKDLPNNSNNPDVTNIRLLSFPEAEFGNNTTIQLMGIAVVFVLILSCINVSNLLFSRAVERSKESAVRMALGAPISRLIMQMMGESLIICLVGGVFAVLIAQIGLEITQPIFNDFYTIQAPYFWQFEMDLHSIIIAALLTVFTAIVTGVLPSWKLAYGDFNQVLRDGTRGAQGRHSAKVSKTLVVLEVAISCGLLTAASMLSFANYEATQSDYGFEPNNMLTARIQLPTERYPTKEAQNLFFATLIDDLRAQAGVQQVAGFNPLLGNGPWYRDIEYQGFEKTKINMYPHAFSAEVYPGSLEQMGINLVEGRYFTAADEMDSEPVAIVTQSFVEDIWPNETSIVGQKVRFGPDDGTPEYEWRTVVGVVEHVIQTAPYKPQKRWATIFTSLRQNQWGGMNIVLNGQDDPHKLKVNLDQAIYNLDPHLATYDLGTLEEKRVNATSGISFISNVFNIFGLTSLFLAATGIYAVISRSVQQRTHELGIRRALGASENQIIGMLMKQGFIQVSIGIMLGLPFAYLLGDRMLKMIGEDSLLIYSMLVVIPLIIITIVATATYVPSKRAVTLEPNSALRYE